MWLALLVCHLAIVSLLQAQNSCSTHPTFRKPVNSDIDVVCGTEKMELEILLCPIYFCGYNESLMALNSRFDKEECKGTTDWTVDPPVLRFNFSISEESIAACSNTMMVTQEVGTGIFADFSNVQFVNISGRIKSNDPDDTGTITYKQDVLYKFSCHYPLQYLVNRTEMSVSGVSLAYNENNGSFISALSMRLYSEHTYTTLMQIPSKGLELKTRIFVEVKATNLTDRFKVLLDRCYATTTPFPLTSDYYDLFVGCNLDGQTMIDVNGLAQAARFSFEAFRFVQHENRTLSTYYVHCATRLCEASVCASLFPNCSRNGLNRVRRSVHDPGSTTVTEEATVTSTQIITHVDRKLHDSPTTAATAHSEAARETGGGSVLGVSIAAGILAALCVTLMLFIGYRLQSKGNSSVRHPFLQQT